MTKEGPFFILWFISWFFLHIDFKRFLGFFHVFICYFFQHILSLTCITLFLVTTLHALHWYYTVTQFVKISRLVDYKLSIFRWILTHFIKVISSIHLETRHGRPRWKQTPHRLAPTTVSVLQLCSVKCVHSTLFNWKSLKCCWNSLKKHQIGRHKGHSIVTQTHNTQPLHILEKYFLYIVVEADTLKVCFSPVLATLKSKLPCQSN